MISITKICETNISADNTGPDIAEKPFFTNLKLISTMILTNWKNILDYNRLSLNIPKCEFMLIGTHQVLANMPKLKATFSFHKLIPKNAQMTT